MINFTPGPWVALSRQDSAYGLPVHIESCGGAPVASVYRLEADAHLIAAAPDLLAALQAIVEEADGPSKPYSSDSYLPSHMIQAARAAIAKATGACHE